MGERFRLCCQLLVLLIIAACQSARESRHQEVEVRVAAQTPEMIATLAPDALFRSLPGLAARIFTKAEIRRGLTVLTIEDEKKVARTQENNFEITIRRTHKGSEAGDTVETFSAVKVGTEYFTRGSGGPFVRWDDALDEPYQMLVMSLGETHSVLAFLKACIREERVGDTLELRPVKGECVVGSPPEAASMVASVLEVSGRIRFLGGRPARCDLLARLKVESQGHVAMVDLTHEATFDPISEGYQVTAPRDAIWSRRDRPITTISSVLSGLAFEWGPGAPDVVRSQGVKSGKDSEPDG